MKKLIVITILLVLLFAIGCSSKQDRTLVSRPITKEKDQGYTVEPAQETVNETEPATKIPKTEPKTEPTYEPPTKSTTVETSGSDSCDVLTGSEVGAFMGGAYVKTDNCPVHPQMPKGVTVCQCGYDWKTNFVDIEVQTYSDGSEGRVFNMYCSSTNVDVGDKACKWTSPSDVDYVYFLSGNKFVKVSCRGICDSTKMVNMAKSLESKI